MRIYNILFKAQKKPEINRAKKPIILILPIKSIFFYT